MDILAMLKICMDVIISALLMPGANLGFILLVFIIYSLYRRMASFQEIAYGSAKVPVNRLVITSVLWGIAAGIGVSIPMVLIGVAFDKNLGIQYLVFISILLMLIEPRFLCFAYSGGLLAILSLLFGVKNVDATGIMVLVGTLHLLESVLIYFDGHRGAAPVLMEREDGSIVGGFSMQRFWPIPMAMVLFLGYEAAQISGAVETPQWWPVIRPYIEPGRIGEAFFSAVPVTAILGYSEFTSSCLPKEKCKRSSMKLALFSLMLLLLAVISSKIYVFKYIAALFAPLGHEYLIEREKKLERKRQPMFLPSDKGLVVLDTMAGSPGEKMGIMPGDTIVSINNRPMTDKEIMEEFFKDYVTFIWVDVIDRFGNLRTLEYKDYRDGIDSLGVIIIPQNKEGFITLREQKSFIKKLWAKFFK